jgi:CRISPR-associated protein Cmr4
MQPRSAPNKTGLLFFAAETALHAGTGSTVAAIDLPIQRERMTHYPIIQGSGVKGALRSQCQGESNAIQAVFGPEVDTQGSNGAASASDFAGAVAFSDARILLFPVRALQGVFAYVTSPLALARLARDAQIAGVMDEQTAQQFTITDCPMALPASQKHIIERSVVLEEYTFPVTGRDSRAAAIATWLADHALPQDASMAFWRAHLAQSLIILPENDFRDFVENSTEIVTRVALDRTKKTVAGTALWTQEQLPAESVLYSTVTARPLRSTEIPPAIGERDAGTVLRWLAGSFGAQPRIQIGGDETTGLGIVALQW